MVNAKEMMKRLREEAKEKKALALASLSGDSALVPVAVVAVQPAMATPSPTQNKASSSISSSNQHIWQSESLFERNVVLEGGTGPGRGSALRLLEDPMGTLAGGNGATLWDCSLALTRFLAEHYTNTENNSLAGKSVLELGSGLGLVGMAMAAMGAKEVVATERALALPLLTKNVHHNQEITGNRMEVMELSWGSDATKMLLADRDRTGQNSFDIVVGSDLVFPSNSDAYPLLADTLSALLGTRKVGDPKLELWQSHEPRRPEVEAQFWLMLEERGIHVHGISATDGLPSSHPEDIMILQLTLMKDGAGEARS